MSTKRHLFSGLLSYAILVQMLLFSGHQLWAQTAVGGSTPDPSAMLDVQSNEKGVLFPRMNTSQRDLIQNAALGLMIFNTTTECLEINLSSVAPASWSGIICRGKIATISCATASLSGSLVTGQAATGVSVSVPYTGGNGGVYASQTVTSTGVTGLTATLSAGSLASGNGNLSYSITGTPSAAGTAAFALNVGGQSCTLNLVVERPFALYCEEAIRKGEMQPNFSASGVSVIVPYTGATGQAHSGQTVMSTGVTGYTATLAAGSFGNGSGTLTYEITGMSNTTGTANFALSVGGLSCNLDLEVKSCSAKINATDTRIFLCYNLGAYNTRKSHTDPSWEINGGYWQWGIKAEAAPGPIGPAAEQANDGTPSPWNTTPAADGSWVDDPTTKTNEDPCPDGFRVPSKAQWEGVDNNNAQATVNNSWFSSPTNYVSGRKFGSDLVLPAAGRWGTAAFAVSDGVLVDRGFNGFYWSSTQISNAAGSNFAHNLEITLSTAQPNYKHRTSGNSVRCIED